MVSLLSGPCEHGAFAEGIYQPAGVIDDPGPGRRANGGTESSPDPAMANTGTL
jgi:hypothetical protein